jgi:WD40 repeat protein
LLGIASYLGYQRASDQFALRIAETRAQARENESHLVSLKEGLERQRQNAEKNKELAEREARFMTARYFASQAQDLSVTHPWHGIATAVNAVNATLLKDGVALPEAHQSLRDAVARCPAVYGIDGASLEGHQGGITALATSSDGRWLATGSKDHTVRLWDLRALPQRRSTILRRHAAPISHLAFSSDCRWLVTGSEDSTACLWDLNAPALSWTPVLLPGNGRPISKLAMSLDGRWLAIVFSADAKSAASARLWNLSAGPNAATSLELTGHGRQIQAVAISPKSRWLAMAVDDAIHLWDLDARVPAIASLGRQCRHGAITAASFTPDGKWLITSGRDGAARLWNLLASDPSTFIELRAHAAPIQTIAVGRDSRWLVIAGHDQALTIWDLHSADPVAAAHRLTVGQNAIRAATISDDGRWIAASCADGKVHMWAMTNDGPEKTAVVLRSGMAEMSALAFTADGHWLAAAGSGRSVRLWNVDVHDLMNRATSVAMGRKASIVFRYPWLDPTQTVLGRILRDRIATSNSVLAWHSARRHLAELHARTVSLAFAAHNYWAAIQPQLGGPITVQSISPSTGVPSAAPKAATAPVADKTRFEARRATQGNTLRVLIR